MQINGILTKNGGKVHIHFGKQCTTNLWGTWVIVSDMNMLMDLKKCCNSTEFLNVRSKYQNTWQNLTVPYVRTPGAPGAPTPQTATQSAQPAQPTQPEQTEQTEEPYLDESATLNEEPAKDDIPAPQPTEEQIRCARIDAVGRLQKFFSEFKFTPAARFVNTLARCKSEYDAQAYVNGYVRLINNSDANDIIEKMKSPEFSSVVADLIKYPPEKQINTRLEIYFGDAGTGKTTKAIEQNPGADVVPCNASMLPDELMRTFDFNDQNGNPVFKPSSLRLAMEAGKTIIFDEINLLSFDCLRLLQTLTDGKSTINYNGDTIEVKDGFKIIGTMNLTVNDQVYNLPEPLVDRCTAIKEFKLSTEELAGYAF